MYQLGFLVFFLLLCSGCKQDASKAGYWSVTKVESLPEAVSNQPVSEGFVGEEAYLYTFGGIDSTKLFSGIHRRSYRMHVKSGLWERLEDIPDSLGKIAAAASRIENIIYILGGYHVFEDGKERSSNRVHRFDISKNSFLPDGAPIPVPIDDHVQAVWKNRYIFVITGWSERQNVPNVQVYDSAENSWIEVSSVPRNEHFMSFGASGSIVGDTIFYLGGAAMGQNFPVQPVLRKGVIKDDNPAEIEWTCQQLDGQFAGYRMAAFQKDGQVIWVGGSNVTYNFNGLAYEGKAGVFPNHRILTYDGLRFYVDFNKNINMDLRGIANIDDSVKYLLGGMGEGQRVSRGLVKLEWIE